MYEPFPAPDFSLQDLAGGTRSLAALRGKPAIVLLWSFDVAAARAALETLERGAQALTRAGVGSIAIAVDAPPDQASLRTLPSGATPVVIATPEVRLSYAILNRHLFMNRQDLRLPTCLLLDGSGNVVKVYRDRVDVDQIVKDASTIDVSPAERLARAVPFQGTFYSGLPLRNYLPYGRELLDSGLERAAVMAFERAAQANPGASDAVSSGHAARQKRGDGPSPRRVRARPRPATGSGRGQQRSRSAARAGGRSRRGHRSVSCGAGVDSGVPRRAEQSWLCPPADRPR